MRLLVLHMLATATQSVTTGWDSQGATEVIFVTRPEACAATVNPTPPEALDFQLPPLFGGEMRDLVPVIDSTRNRTDLNNLRPRTSGLPLYYVEKYAMDNGTYTASIDFQFKNPTVVLENSDCVTNLALHGSWIKITFCSQAAFDVAREWPQTGVVLVTNDPELSNTNERGVYITKRWVVDSQPLTLDLFIEPTTWGAVATTMTIRYGRIETDNQSESSPPSGPTRTYLGVSPITTAPASTTAIEEPSGTSEIELAPPQKSLYEQVSADASFRGSNNATLILQLRSLATVTPSIEIVRCDKTGPCRNTVDTALANDGLPNEDQLVQAALNAADSASSQPYAITPDMQVTENFDAAFAVYNGGGGVRTRKTRGATKPALQARGYWGTIFNGLKEYLATNFFSALCQSCDTLPAGYSGRETAAAASKLLGVSIARPTARAQAVAAVNLKTDIGMLPNTYVVDANSGTRVTCIKCGISVSSMTIEGTIVADVETGSIINATMDTMLSQTVDLMLDFKTAGYASLFWYESTLYTKDLPALNVPNILIISPKFLVGIGVTYEASKKLNFSTALSLSFNNARIKQQDLLNSKAGIASGWEPSVNITWPTLWEPATVRISPYLRSSMQTSIQLFGKVIQNATRITQVHNFGVDARVEPKIASRLDDLDRFSGVSPVNDLNDQLLRRQSGSSGVATCPANGMKLTAMLTSHIESGFDSKVLNGGAQVLLDKSYPFGSRCLTLKGSVGTTTTTSTSRSVTSSAVSSKPSTTSTMSTTPSSTVTTSKTTTTSTTTSATTSVKTTTTTSRTTTTTTTTTTTKPTTTTTTTTINTTTRTTTRTTTTTATSTTTTTTKSATSTTCPNYPAKIPSCNRITYYDSTGTNPTPKQWTLYYAGANGTAGLTIGPTPNLQYTTIPGSTSLCMAFYSCIDAFKSSPTYPVFHLYKFGAAGDQYLCVWGPDVTAAYSTDTNGKAKPFNVPYADVQMAFGFSNCAGSSCQPALCNTVYTPS